MHKWVVGERVWEAISQSTAVSQGEEYEAGEKTGLISGRSSGVHYVWDLQQVIVMMDVWVCGARPWRASGWWQRGQLANCLRETIGAWLVRSNKDKEVNTYRTVFQKVGQEGGPSWFTGIRRQVRIHKRNRWLTWYWKYLWFKQNWTETQL